MNALMIGATGATGKDLLDLLLNDEAIKRVDVFVRRPLKQEHPKLTTHIINFDQPEDWQHLVNGDVLFSCLGTTLKAAGSKKAQWKIDYDYQYEFAKAAKTNGVQTYILVSSGYASSKSPFFYARMKGELEDAVRKLDFPKLSIFNPPILIRKDSDRGMELAGLKLIRFLNKFGLLNSQKPLPTEVLAQAMLNSAKARQEGIRAVSAPEIWALAR